MNVLIVGASAGLGRALAEEAGRRGHDVLLVASDDRDLDALARHLRLSHGVRAMYVVSDLGDRTSGVHAVTAAAAAFGPLDAVLFPAGQADEADDGLLSAGEAARLIDINLTSQVAVIAALWPALQARAGSIVGFGSVAAVRGRSRNMVYAAAKRGLESFYESLMHKAAGTTLRVQFYQVGFLDTPRNAGQKLPLPAGSPQAFARAIFDRLGEARHSAIFFPGYWRYVALALRLTPWFVYKRLRF